MFKWIMRLLSAAVVLLVLWWGRANRRMAPDRSITSFAAQPASKPPSCGDRVIHEQHIGKLQIGMSVDSLMQQCPSLIESNKPGIEGNNERKMTVFYAPEYVEAEIVDGKVWRISVESPAFRTTDAVGVGSSVAEVIRRDEPEGGVGEGAFFLISRKHCGLSYQLSGGIPAGANRRWDKKALSTLPASVEVTRVLVYKCPASGRPDSASR